MSYQSTLAFVREFGPDPKPVRCRHRREHVEPVGDSQDFDWETVYRDLDGEPDRAELDTVAAGCAMMDILDWIEEPVEVNGHEVKTERIVRFKLTVLRLLLRPSTLSGASLTQLALRFGTSAAMLSRLLCDFRDRFGICSRWMASPAAREAYRNARHNAPHNTKESL